VSDYKMAILAGGCFWGMQDLIASSPVLWPPASGLYRRSERERDLPQSPGPRPKRSRSPTTRRRTDFRNLLEFLLSRSTIRPRRNRQGNDVGTSYRSAIFYVDDEQKRVAAGHRRRRRRVGAVGRARWSPRVTPVSDFWEAEPEHQDYLEHYPSGYTCHFPATGLEAAQAADPAGLAGRRPSRRRTTMAGRRSWV